VGLRIVQFVAVIATALALVPGGAHLLSLPAKMAMPEDPYFVAQQVYRGWAWLGITMLIAILANLASAILARGTLRSCVLSAAASVMIVATVAIFFIWTYPANVATGNWTTVPENWEDLRRQWEYSHAISAVVTFIALSCATAAMLPAASTNSPSGHSPSGWALN
jgi:hypothetical protein